ncbi:MAG TPA: hypothetical protein VFS43_30575 [Polyangiaceae bacterium]|nr:hypothetical protein [Polyangiaceae bacterium]
MQALALGWGHSCALLSGGEARCWGDNNTGQLGNGTVEEQHTPVAVLASPGGPPLVGVQALALGILHSCAWIGGGDVRCWGFNFYGQLGTGDTADRPTPVPVQFEPGGGGAP